MAGSNRVRNQFLVEQELRAQGLPRLAIAALLGRIEAESSFDPEALNPNDPGGSEGLLQWNGARRTAMQKFVESEIGDSEATEEDIIRAQTRFLAAEVKGEIGTEKRNGERLINATNARQATEAVMGFTRPAGFTRSNPSGGLGFDKTLNFAQSYINATSNPGTRNESPFASGREFRNTASGGGGSGDSNQADLSQPEVTPLDRLLIGITEGLKTADFSAINSSDELRIGRGDELLNQSSRSVSNFLRTLPGVGLQSIRRG